MVPPCLQVMFLLWSVTTVAVLGEMQLLLTGALYIINLTWHSVILDRPLEAALV